MSKPEIIELNDKNWEKHVEKSQKPVMVLFYSPTCPNCSAMEPHFKQYADEFNEKVIFAKINIMNSLITASRYGVMGTPTFKFFCFGKPVNELVGAVYPSLLKKTVEDSIKSSNDCVKNTTWIDPGIDGYA